MKKLFGAVSAALLAVALLPGVSLAQTAASGNIEGVVKDASGAVLPGVTVVVKNTETNISREVVSDEGGRYRVSALQPGTYEVTATLAGFEATPIGKVTVQVGQIQAVDLRMRPAGVAEAITVTGETPVIDTQKTDVSNVVGEKAIQNLPINGRRWENFVLLSPGVTNDGTFGLVSYRGISGLYNNNTVDGVDNNQAFFSEARGRTRASYSISQASIREFQVGISNFSAEFGRAAGGTVNAVTKSGTNQLRGEAFYFLRDDAFQAKDFFAPFKPDEKRQQFGVSAGGPIKQDKTFFFTTFDQQLRDFPGFTRPSQGDAFYNGACTAPGCAATIAYFRGLNTFFPREGNNRIFLGKVDHQFTPAHNFTAQYNIHRWDSPSGQETRAVVTVSEDAIAKDIVKTDVFVSSLNSVLSNTWLNEIRFQYGRDFEAQIPNGVPPSTTTASSAGGIDFGMQNFLPRAKYPDERRIQFIDNVSWYKGNHSLKTGVDINYVRETLINLFQGGGVYNYNSLQNIAADCPPFATGCTPLVQGAATDGRHYGTYTQQFDLRGNGLRGDAFFTTNDFNWFIQDNWRVNPTLTVNLGLRYEYQKLPQPGKAATNGIVFTGNPAYPATTSFNQDKNNFGPRAGFTYDIGGVHQTIVRGGFGVYYGRTSNSILFTALTSNAVTFATYTFTPTSVGAPQYPTVFAAPPSGTGARPSIQYLSPDLERPEIYSGDVTIDRLIGRDVTVSASYLYSKGKHLPTFTDTNLPAPNAQVRYTVDGQSVGDTYPFYRGTRPDANINNAIVAIDSVESDYHALVLQANKRFSGGLLFNTSYTLSRAEDSGQNSTTFMPSFAAVYDPQNLDFERGTSNFDRTHRFVGSFHYAPDYLWGVQFGGVVTVESGLPVTPTISGAVAGTGAVSTASTNGSGASNRSPFDERNSFRQDGRQTFDVRLSKVFRLGGTVRFEALVEAFNVFNHTNFTGFNARRYTVTTATFDAATNLATVNLATDSTFLTPNAASSTLFGPRDMQIGFKLLW